MYLSVDVDDAEIRGIIEDECENAVKLEAKLMADAEITKQFESIQGELEGCALRHVNEKLAKMQSDVEDHIEKRIAVEIYDLNEYLNRELLKAIRNLKITLDAPVVRGEMYLESGEGTAGKERAAKEYNDTIPMEDL
jgi:hypothetical protein